MHNHSFGDYLLENEYITSEQFLEALQELKLDSRPSFEVCGLYDRTVTYETFEALMDKPEYPKMSIRELAVKYGIITPQIIEIVESQHYPLFVALAQILLSKGYLDYRSCQEAFLDYESESELYEFEADEVVSGDTEGIIEQLCSGLSDANDVVTRLFFKLMFENLYENIGHDFTILDPFECNEYPTNILVSQDIIRDDMTYTFAIDLNKTTLLGFAERFSDMEFTEVDDYSIAAVEDFINLHNGIFNVNLSNDFGIEATLSPPTRYMGDLFSPIGRTYMLPIVYPFGVFNLIISTHTAEDDENASDIANTREAADVNSIFDELGIDVPEAEDAPEATFEDWDANFGDLLSDLDIDLDLEDPTEPGSDEKPGDEN